MNVIVCLFSIVVVAVLGIFDTDPISERAVATVATKVASASPIKVKPTTKPTPTLVSNTYECLANDNNDDDDDGECADRTVAIKQEPRTGKTVKGKNTKKKTTPGRDESDSRGDTDTRPVVMETRELGNTRIKKKQPPTTAVVDLGTMITTNKGMPGVDNEDDASAMTGTTKNLGEVKYNQQIDILEGFFDTDTTNEEEHPTKRKKYRTRKPYRHQKKCYGKQAANSTEGTGGLKRNFEGD